MANIKVKLLCDGGWSDLKGLDISGTFEGDEYVSSYGDVLGIHISDEQFEAAGIPAANLLEKGYYFSNGIRNLDKEYEVIKEE